MAERVVAAEHMHVRDLFHLVQGQRAEGVFAALDRSEADGPDVFDRHRQPHSPAGVDGAGLELVRRGGVGRAVAADRLDHLAAVEERRHFVEQFAPAVQHADAHRRQHFVTGKGEKIDAEVPDVHGLVRRALRAVGDEDRAVAAAQFGKSFEIVFHAQHVGNVRHRRQPRARRQRRGERFRRQGAVRRAVGEFQRRAGSSRDLLPRQQIAVMLHDADEDLVAGAQKVHAVAVGHEVQALGGVAREDDLLGRGGVDELLHGRARVFVNLGRRHAQPVKAAQRVGVAFLVIIAHGVQHALWFLRRRRVVEIDQFLIGKNRKVAAQALVFPFQFRFIHRPFLRSTSVPRRAASVRRGSSRPRRRRARGPSSRTRPRDSGRGTRDKTAAGRPSARP